MAAPRRILVVGDDRALRDSLRELLEQHGHAVEVCSGGDEALVRLRAAERGPAMVIVDLDLLDLSGWGLLEILRADDRLRDVPVAVLTDDPHLRELEGLTVVTRPVHEATLLAWCARHLGS